MFDLNHFISEYVTKRQKSMFLDDIENKREEISKKIKDKSVLVIGGAGSIGSSFIKAILPYEPKSLVVADINENALAELTRDLRSTPGMYVPKEYMPYPMDYSSCVFEKMFRANKGFDIVANFSAHKHVRSEKGVYSIEALLRNNVLNVKAFLELLAQFPPEEYFCVSTDKAANPVNIMGASKRIMEDLIFSYSHLFPVKTARFANVAFSNGSLPSGFLKRISSMQPISAPSDVKRYFVSPEESGQICMLSCILGKNREIFFPKLGVEQMTTFDAIAVNLIREYGYGIQYCSSDSEALEQVKYITESGKYPVHFEKADTSGEKAFEEFFVEGEKIDSTRFRSLGVITDKQASDAEDIDALLNRLETLFARENVEKADIVDALGEYLNNFVHLETGKSLDGKM